MKYTVFDCFSRGFVFTWNVNFEIPAVISHCSSLPPPITTLGELIQSDFTLTRVLKKRKSKPLVSATQSQPDPAAEGRPSSPLFKATEDQPMQSMGRERSVTEGSKESNTEL